MKYDEMKKIDLKSISNKEDAEKNKNEILNSDENDILKYINYLRYTQFNGSIDDMKCIVNFLAFKEFKELERNNSKIDFGDVEELYFDTKIVLRPENSITIENDNFVVKAMLVDDYETVFIAKDNEDKFKKFGFILDKDNIYFIYELITNKAETDEFFQNIIDAEIGTKINVLATYVGVDKTLKTFRKVEIDADYKYVKAEKSSLGVITNVIGGTFITLKDPEKMISPQLNIKEEEKPTNSEDDLEKLDEELEVVNDEEDKIDYDNINEEFKFSDEYHFELIPFQDDLKIALNFNGKKSELTYDKNKELFVKSEYEEEVYNFLTAKYNLIEDMEGVWFISNNRIDSIVRGLINAGAIVNINFKETESDFLTSFESVLKKIKDVKIDFIKSFKTMNEIKAFAKEAGTEQYLQINQVNTAMLEGVKKLYDDTHVIFDSDSKLVICKVNNKDENELAKYGELYNFTRLYILIDDTWNAIKL